MRNALTPPINTKAQARGPRPLASKVRRAPDAAHGRGQWWGAASGMMPRARVHSARATSVSDVVLEHGGLAVKALRRQVPVQAVVAVLQQLHREVQRLEGHAGADLEVVTAAHEWENLGSLTVVIFDRLLGAQPCTQRGVYLRALWGWGGVGRGVTTRPPFMPALAVSLPMSQHRCESMEPDLARNPQRPH